MQLVLRILFWVFLLAQEISATAPTGCTIDGNNYAACDFSTTTFPLNDADFSPAPYDITITNMDGTMPSNAFSGITGTTDPSKTRMLRFDCSNNDLILQADTLTSNMNYILHLYFNYCNLTLPDNSFQYMTGTTEVTFFSGKIFSMSSGGFNGLSAVTTMSMLAVLESTTLPLGLFDPLTSLQSLTISAANLVTVPSGAFDQLTQLTGIDLGTNALTTLPSGLFAQNVRLATVKLTGNSWNCDCDLDWLATYLVSTGLTSTTSVPCSTPASLSSVELIRAATSFSCSTSSTSSSSDSLDPAFKYGVIAGLCLLGLISIIALGLVLYMYYSNSQARVIERRATAPNHTKFRNKTADNHRAKLQDSAPSPRTMTSTSISKIRHSNGRVTPSEIYTGPARW